MFLRVVGIRVSGPVRGSDYVTVGKRVAFNSCDAKGRKKFPFLLHFRSV